MKTEIVVKSWSIKKEENKPEVITGIYAVMLGTKEIATQTFNGGYGGQEIVFEREIQDTAKQLSARIAESIQKSFE